MNIINPRATTKKTIQKTELKSTMEDVNPTILTALTMKRLIKAEGSKLGEKKKVPYAADRIH